MDCSLSEDQLRHVRSIFPGMMLYDNRTFVQQSEAIHTSDLPRLWCSNEDPHLNADNIHGLNGVWRDIQATLSQVGQCCNNYSDRGTSTTIVIMEDFNSLVKELTLNRHMMDYGS